MRSVWGQIRHQQQDKEVGELYEGSAKKERKGTICNRKKSKNCLSKGEKKLASASPIPESINSGKEGINFGKQRTSRREALKKCRFSRLVVKTSKRLR